MNAELANIFIRSAKEVFEKEASVKLSRKDLVKKDSPMPTNPVAIVIGVTGMLRGQVVYAMDENFSYHIARAMLPNKLPIDVKRLQNSAVSEIANIITGRASIALAGESGTIELTPPMVLMATDLSLDFLHAPTICLSFICESGVMEINVALIDPERGGN